MRVLWLCNCPLSDADIAGTGSWLGSMALGLLESGEVELGIIAFGPVKHFQRHDHGQVKQWLVPSGTRLGRDGLPAEAMVQAIVSAAKAFSPDLVHVWGTESFWGLLTARGVLSYPALLEMQGLKGQIAQVFHGGLTMLEQLGCIGIKELLKRRTMRADKRDFARWRLREEEMIHQHPFIDVQSLWVDAQVRAIQPEACTFPIDLALRQPFYDAEGWQPNGLTQIFCIAAYSSPFKGLHVAIRALAHLKRRIPAARLRVAGAHQRPGFRQDGYMRWINQLIHRLNLGNSVEWLGPLNAEQVVRELQQATVTVIPTFIENCCTSMQEAMAVGTPVVAAHAGGIPSLGKDEASCLFFPPGDAAMCAYQMERLCVDTQLAQRLSGESRKVAATRNDRQRIFNRQLEIYRKVIDGQT